ncbi:MAG TPA: penicillin acylase family protein [Isosphaeraceae bacterium]|nr:penicillin acylase family protein [Isosphaeraceae bacterium]
MKMRLTRSALALGCLVLILVGSSARAAAPGDDSATTIYRDDYGIPHIDAPTLEAAAYAMGYAQAEDRLEELLKNYRRASGTMAEVFGPRFYDDDLAQRIWRHAEVSRDGYQRVSPKMRAVLEAYIAGVRQFMAEHPEQVPAWAQEIHPWDAIALARYIIWGWPMGEAVHDLEAAGLKLTPPAYRGSNEVLIAPGRSALKAPIAIVDPHLSWYGAFRFYEARIYARDDQFQVSGVAILGQPIPSLGHSRYCSVAMTTGGPDTSDVYEEDVNPDNPRSYRFDSHWRPMTVRTYTIGVKEKGRVQQRTVDVEYTHHGPIVARKGNKAYAIAIPYRDEVGLGDQIYEMMKARNLDEMKQALGRLQLMAQNVMVGTVQGDIYYLRNGRVPIRAPGVDPSRPVPGHTSAHEWQGIHPLSDLVQVTNPPGGWMQNCNCSPAAMMLDSPMVPETYRARPYLFNVGRVATHQRAQMMNALLAAADKVTVDQAIAIAFNPQVYRAESWQARVKEAWSGARDASRAGDAAAVVRQIAGWDRRCDPDSTGALAYYAFKQALGKELGAQVEPPAGLKDGQVVEALHRAAQWLRSSFGAVEVPYGRYFRVGREGGERTWPLGGGSLREQGMATPRAVSFAPSPDGKAMIGHGGQTSTQVIIMTDPPQSYAVIPLGESDHKESGHWDDQAEKLFSKGRVAPTYFLNRAELLKHVTSTKVLHPELPRQAAR